uniref:BHLH domain-containing protein n=1 Tax=Oryza brachyantha TaxID=4533 RepID=J3LRH7_ORYBR
MDDSSLFMEWAMETLQHLHSPPEPPAPGGYSGGVGDAFPSLQALRDLASQNGMAPPEPAAHEGHRASNSWSSGDTDSGGGGTGPSSAAPYAQEHIIAERKRREKINQRFIELSTVIPGLKKMDKATILSDAVRYVKELQEKLSELEDQNGRSVESSLPEIEAKISHGNVMVRIHCESGKGLVVRLLAAVEGLHLAITHTNVMPFPACTAIITIMAKECKSSKIRKVDDGFSVTAENIVGKLNTVLQQNSRNNNNTTAEETRSCQQQETAAS